MKQLTGVLRNYFLKGSERSLVVKRNVIISFLIKGISVVVGFVIVPVTIGYINKTQYGMWLTLSSIIGWFSFFDIGLGNGLRNKLATAIALNDLSNAKRYVSTTYILVGAIALLAALIFYFVNPFISWNHVLNANEPGLDLGRIVLWLFFLFCFQFVFQLINVVLTAHQESANVSVILLIGQLASAIGIFLLSKFTVGSLFYLVLVLTGLPPLVQMIASIYLYSGKLKLIAPSFKDLDLSNAKELLGLGGYFFVIQLGVIVLYQTSNIIITQLMGPEEVTTFNIAYKLFSVVTILLTIAITPFWSAFTDAYAKNDFEWIQNILKKIRLFWVIVAIGATFLLFISPIFYKLWIGDSVHITFSLSFVVFLNVLGNAWVATHCYFLNGVGKIRLQLVMYIFCILVNIPLSIMLGRVWGIQGVVVSSIIIHIIMGFVFYIQTEKIIAKNALGIWNK
ncbi:oligosaccharide flippase family protein [Flavihumibacter profundi]|uniref:oligosaccharide flippase family protein n=1 Tax=Flavihumibacter profundi TaxID=2716883 RepID=UPI001CC559AB|nr:oligosaccharide flippase family protein [Flavihumibacter profundi]MBZ5855766.1 oligosaccharide flippase family protein [Flavihumibacter profundi]